jgi:regulatory protein
MKREVKAVEAAAKALARRDRSAGDLVAYLEQHGIEAAAAAQAVERLAQAGYIDDSRLARNRAEALAGRGWGDEGIRHDLVRRALPGEAVEAALAGLEPEAARALALVERLGRDAKTARRLAAKGFSEDAIESALTEP